MKILISLDVISLPDINVGGDILLLRVFGRDGKNRGKNFAKRAKF